MNVAIVKYNAGNIQSVLFALERLGVQALVTDDHEQLKQADKIIFPGVGEASSAMLNLQEKKLDKVIVDLKQPVLGICVGMQLLCKHSEENDTQCLKVFPLDVLKFQPTPRAMKVPQVGWNTIDDLQTNLFNGLRPGEFIYNVHSYYVEDSEYTIARCNYGVQYAAAIKKDNFYGVQFHAEKSSVAGDQILKNFLSL